MKELPDSRQDGYVPVRWESLVGLYLPKKSSVPRVVGGGLVGIGVGMQKEFKEARSSAPASTHDQKPKDGSEYTPEEIQLAEERAKQDADFMNHLEEFPIQDKPIPSALSPRQKDLAERVKSDYEKFGMVIVALEPSSEQTEIEELLESHQRQLEAAQLEAMLQDAKGMLDLGEMDQDVFDAYASDIAADIDDILANGSRQLSYETQEYVQEIVGQPPRKIKIYAAEKNWTLKNAVTRGRKKIERATAHTRKLPLEGKLWRTSEYEHRDENPDIQPVVILSEYRVAYM